MKVIVSIFVAVCITSACRAENARNLSGPSLGYVKRLDGVRQIVGVPGAAYFAPALALDGTHVAAVGPQQGYAVLLTPDRMTAQIVDLESMHRIALLPRSESAVTAVYLSTNEKTVALARDGSIAIFSGLPKGSALKKTVPALAGSIALAISDDGEVVAASDGQGLFLIDSDGQRQIAVGQSISDVRFRQDSRDVLYADKDSVFVVDGQGTRLIVGPEDNISSARAATFSRDGRYVIVTDVESQDVVIAQSSGGILERVKLPCAGSELTLIDDSTLRLRCESGDQMQLIQLTPNGTRVLFIPEPAE